MGEIEEAIEQIVARVAAYAGDESRNLLLHAARFANACHTNGERVYRRLNGSPYIFHPLAVANILADWYAPPEVIAAALLHDVQKDHYSQRPSLEALQAAFPSSVVDLVRDVAQLGRFGPALAQGPVIESQREGNAWAAWASAVLQRSPAAMVIKIADRLHNLQNLHVLREERQNHFATVGLNIFAPFAERLGMYAAKRMLQDACFAVLHPKHYQEIDRFYQEVSARRRVNTLQKRVEALLQEKQVPGQVLLRVTNHYGIAQRQQLADKERRLIPGDIVSLIVVLESTEACYQGLGLMHNTWPPQDGFHDYIALPKSNGYRALHTTVLDDPREPDALGPFHIILCSKEMYLVAEYGITAAWQGVRSELLPKIEPPPKRPEGSIMTLTPQGQVIYLPSGATPVDFAYAIHTELGHSCLMALVNGGIKAPLEDPLHDGDTVEIVRSRGVTGPNERWLQSVKTEAAREAIQNWFKRRKKRQSVEFVIEGRDRAGLLRDITETITDNGLNMTYLRADVLVDGTASIRLGIGQILVKELPRLAQALKEIPSVARVKQQEHAAPPYADQRSLARFRDGGSLYTLKPVLGNAFKGREQKILELVSKLESEEQDNALLVWGPRHIGKTSLLRYLERDILPPLGYLPIYVSLIEVMDLPIAYFLHRIAVKVEQKLQSERNEAINALPKIQRAIPSQIVENPLPYFQRYIQRVGEIKDLRSLVLILDDFHRVSSLKEVGTTCREVFSYLGNIFQDGDASQERVRFNLISSGEGIPRRLLNASRLSSFLPMIDEVRVWCLEEDQARALITGHPFVKFTDEAVNRLWFLTNGYPYYLQYLCLEVLRTPSPSDAHPHPPGGERLIDASDVDLVVERFLEKGLHETERFRHFWEIDPDDQLLCQKNRLILSVIARHTNSAGPMLFHHIAARTSAYIHSWELHDLLTNLALYGSIKVEGGGEASRYAILVPFFERWLRAVPAWPGGDL